MHSGTSHRVTCTPENLRLNLRREEDWQNCNKKIDTIDL